MSLSRTLYLVAALAVTVSVGAYTYFVPKPAAIGVGTVVSTPKPSAPPTDKKVLLRRAIAGDSDAQCRLSGRFWSGTDGLPYNPPLAYYWASLSASAHDPCGINNLGVMYEDGFGVQQDRQAAIGLYNTAASLGDLNAMANLGRVYYYGDGVERNVITALAWYKKGADLGDFTSLRQLGEIYGWGEGVPLNIDRSSAYLLRANPVHDGEASYDLGWLYYRYYPRAGRCEQARRWLTISANLGDADGEAMLGWLYDTGVCVARPDAKVAAKWYLASLDRIPSAETGYAMLFWKGRLGPPDKARAVRYLTDAAARGDEDAMYVLGVSYDHGIGVLPNEKTAWAYFTAAAARGHGAAVSVVAMAYLDGVRVKQDKVRGLGMLLGVESLGVTFPSADKARLEERLTAAQLDAARQFAFTFASEVRKNSDAYPWLSPPINHDRRID